MKRSIAVFAIVLVSLASSLAQQKQVVTSQPAHKVATGAAQRATANLMAGRLVDSVFVKEISRLARNPFSGRALTFGPGDDCAFGPSYCSCYCGEVEAYCESIGEPVLYCNCGGGWSCVQEICC